MGGEGNKMLIMKLEVCVGGERYLLEVLYGFYVLYMDVIWLEEMLVEW